MFNHSDIWNAIDKLAEDKGISTSGLAKMAGLDPTTFNKSKRTTPSGRLRWPSTESISKILLITETPLAEFMQYLSGDAMRHHLLTVPSMDEKTALKTKLFDKNGMIVADDKHKVSFPASDHQKLFCFEVTSDQFAPDYRSGDTLILDINADIRKNDRIVVKTKNLILIGSLKKDMANRLIIEMTNGKEKEIDKSALEWSGRILWLSQ